ncbi:hypothetical protein NDA16_003390 [Ustilago loliicola]|nr:hypothetical protein NDA16_003390 [Ustilago loliicola]
MEEQNKKLTEQEEFERKCAETQRKDEAKTDKNRAKREKKRLAALKAQAAAKGKDPSKISTSDPNARAKGEPEAKKQRLHNDTVERVQFKRKDDSDSDGSANDG